MSGDLKPDAPRAQIAFDQWRALHQGIEGVEDRQQRRLDSLLAHTVAESKVYRERYRGRATDAGSFAALPPITKPELMQCFDDWVTDDRVSLADVREFIADPSRIGSRYLDEFFVTASSGTSGHPGVFLHDRFAVSVYRAFTSRLEASWLSPVLWPAMLRHHLRWVAVVGTGGHFAGEGWMELLRHRNPVSRRSFHVISLQRPLDRVVAELNELQPAVLTSYPSALAALVTEQRAGRLRISPVFIEPGGETLTSELRVSLQDAFGCPVHDAYSASEALVIAYDCDHEWLHLNADWFILEPVEADGTPTPPGRTSHTAWFTNLANHSQPLIRYDLGDAIHVRQTPCPCGNPLPALKVTGRSGIPADAFPARGGASGKYRDRAWWSSTG